MRTETTHTDLYQFDELDQAAKDTALQNLYDINVDHEWWNFTFDDFKAIGTILGIEIDKIYFSGFSSQGDGAQFTGSYTYAKGSAKAIRAYAPKDTDLHDIADNLAAIQKVNFYRLSATVNSRGHYSHAYCTYIDVLKDNDYYSDYPHADTEDSIAEYLRDFMNWMYSRLNEEYDYLTSEECIIESIQSNEYEFDSDGILH